MIPLRHRRTLEAGVSETISEVAFDERAGSKPANYKLEMPIGRDKSVLFAKTCYKPPIKK
jgi:hypothetical protein